jgi:hypothetical protein
MEPKVLLPCSQEPATDPRLEPDESSPHLPPLFLSDPFYAYVFVVVSSFQVFRPKFCMHISSFHATCPARPILKICSEVHVRGPL